MSTMMLANHIVKGPLLGKYKRGEVPLTEILRREFSSSRWSTLRSCFYFSSCRRWPMWCRNEGGVRGRTQ
jgi:hypothetical protein